MQRVELFNCTGIDLRTAGMDTVIRQAIEAGRPLPEEIADLLTVEKCWETEDMQRWKVSAA